MDIYKIVLGLGYLPLKSSSDDLPGMKCYAREAAEYCAFVKVWPISMAEAMPFHECRLVIDGIHRSLAEDQGLVEVACGKANAGGEYIYSIVKTKNDPPGMLYTLTMHMRDKINVWSIQGFFEECGVTGQRDCAVMEIARRQKMIKEVGGEGWFKDPYDPNYKNGLLMNLSEQRQFDELFPQHPLSKARELVSALGGEGN